MEREEKAEESMKWSRIINLDNLSQTHSTGHRTRQDEKPLFTKDAQCGTLQFPQGLRKFFKKRVVVLEYINRAKNCFLVVTHMQAVVSCR